MKRTTVKWHCVHGDMVLRMLKTDAANGLSRKAARSRLRKKGENRSFFPLRHDGLLGAHSLFLSPLWWVLLALNVMSLALAFSPSVLFSTVLLSVPTVFWLQTTLQNKQLCHRIDRLWVPNVCVLRDGKERTIAATAVAEGDILLLRQGDVVPCECRILSPERFSVLEPTEDREHRRREFTMEKDGSYIYPYGSPMPPFACRNMLTPYSEILTGSARAVATHVPAAEELSTIVTDDTSAQRKESGIYGAFAPYLKLFQTGSVLACAVLLLLGLFFQKDAELLTSVFLPACTFACSASSSMGMLLLRYPVFRERNAAFSAKSGGAAIRYTASVQRISNLTDVVVTDLDALTDGVLHTESVFCGGEWVRPSEEPPGASLHSVCEAALLFASVETNEASRLGDCVYLQKLLQETAFDTEALRLRVVSCTESATEHPRIRRLELRTHTSKETLLQVEGSFLLRRCVYFAHGENLLLLDESTKRTLAERCDETQKKGGKAFLYYRQSKGMPVLIGGLFLLPTPAVSLASLPTHLKRMGIRLSVLLPTEEEWDASMKLPWKSQTIPAGLSYRDAVAFLESNRVVLGADEELVKVWFAQMHAQRRRVCLVGSRFSSLLQAHAATLSASCIAPSEAHLRDEAESDASIPRKTGHRTPRLLKHTDVLLSCGPDGEGLRGLCGCVTRCRSILLRMQSVFLSWFSLQLLLLSAMLGTMLTGGTLPSAPQLLLLSPVFLSLASLWMSLLPISSELLKHPCKLTKEGIWKRLFGAAWALPPVLGGAVAALLTALLGSVFRLSAAESSTTLFCALLGTVLVLVLRTAKKSGLRLSLSNTWQFVCAVLLLFALLSFFSAWLPSVSEVTTLGVWCPVTVVCALCVPLLYLLADLFFTRFFQRTAK